MVVDSNAREPWPTDQEWRALLPRWFVDACDPEPSAQESQEWLRVWRSATDDERTVIQSRIRWTVSGWVHWFRPENRSWYWWSGDVQGPDRYRVTIEPQSKPFAWDALRWLLRVSGAVEVNEL